MVDAIFSTARASGLVLWWRHIGTHIAALCEELRPPSLNRVIVLMSPYVPPLGLDTKNRVARWAVGSGVGVLQTLPTEYFRMGFPDTEGKLWTFERCITGGEPGSS